MFLLKKLIRLLYVQMMIKECNQVIRQKHVQKTCAIKDLVSEKEKVKCNNIKNDTKMTNFDIIKEKIKENDPNWPEIHYHHTEY